jgi:hypothetical protein
MSSLSKGSAEAWRRAESELVGDVFIATSAGVLVGGRTLGATQAKSGMGFSTSPIKHQSLQKRYYDTGHSDVIYEYFTEYPTG